MAPQPGDTWVTAHGVRMTVPKKGSRFDYVRLDYRLMGKRYQPTVGKDWEVAWLEANRIDALVASEQGDTAGLTIATMAEAWVRAQSTDWSKRYTSDTKAMLKGTVLPMIGAVKLGDLVRSHARELIDSQTSDSKRRQVRALLSSMFSWGIEEQLLQAELRTVLPPVGKSTSGGKLKYIPRESAPATKDAIAIAQACLEPRVYESKHARRDYTPPEWHALLFLLAGFCGMRQGELFGLQGRHIVGDTVEIRRQAQWVDGVLEFSPPKYGSVRDVFIPAKVGDLPLRAMLAKRAKEVGLTGLMFPTPGGTVWHRNNFYRDVMNYPKEQAWAGKEWTLHDLRHHACRKWLDDGLPIADVSRLAGHKTVDVTMKLYISQNEGLLDRARSLYGE